MTVDQQQINQTLADYKLDKYFKTSAKSAEGVDKLIKCLLESIPWQQLPRTSTPQLFQVIRDFLLKCKESGRALVPIEHVNAEVTKIHNGDSLVQREIDTVISLLQSRGLIHRLEQKPSSSLILTKPELINQYASSVIQAARHHPLGIGAVSERDVLAGDISFSGFDRLQRDLEIIVLEATVELLIRHDLCFREMGLLVFPSQINNTRPKSHEEHMRTEVAYRFSGSIETIYASLVVRLSYTDYFQREDQWKYAVEFSRDGVSLGFSMHQIEEGTGELEIYFNPNINEFDRVTFIRFVTDHLRTKGIDIQEEIRLYCPKCGREIINRDAIEVRIKQGFLDIPCQYCPSTNVIIPKSIEQRYKGDHMLIEKQNELEKKVGQRTEQVISQFKVDRQQYFQEEDHRIHILHLSDLHLENEGQANAYLMQLKADLENELKVKRLEYLVVSGDLVCHATEDEFKAAFAMLDGLVKHFGLDANRLIITPGNHDLNWDDSEAAYKFVPKRKLPVSLPDGKYIPAGDLGALLCDDLLYQQRFAKFNLHLYKKVYGGQEYPLEYTKQSLLIERPDDRIVFLALNSCWQIDHNFRNRAGIYTEALARALDQLQNGAYDGWLKIAVCHHPVSGKEMMNDAFMQQLEVHGFQLYMHGHIHESIEGFHKYDDKRGISIVGAGTFGAPTDGQLPGIPLQYNLLIFDPSQSEIIVNTRRKEKPEGAWWADARWGDRNSPKPYYCINVKNYMT